MIKKICIVSTLCLSVLGFNAQAKTSPNDMVIIYLVQSRADNPAMFNEKTYKKAYKQLPLSGSSKQKIEIVNKKIDQIDPRKYKLYALRIGDESVDTAMFVEQKGLAFIIFDFSTQMTCNMDLTSNGMSYAGCSEPGTF